MEDEEQVWFPVPPVCTALWTTEDWDKWISENGVSEPLTIKVNGETWTAVGRNAAGRRIYSKNG